MSLRPLLGAVILAFTSCVQPAYDRTVIYELDVAGVGDTRTVAIRGSDAPLTWERDSALVAIVPDSLYRLTVTYHTGYLKTEAKFVINGTFELRDQPNRRIEFTGDTTRYRATFDRASAAR
jgi:putative oxidoreductase